MSDRDIDIVAGKLLGVIGPAAVLALVSLAAYDAAASLEFGQERVARILGPTTLYGLFALAVFALLAIRFPDNPRLRTTRPKVMPFVSMTRWPAMNGAVETIMRSPPSRRRAWPGVWFLPWR